jgi:hypothetical protein
MGHGGAQLATLRRAFDVLATASAPGTFMYMGG